MIMAFPVLAPNVVHANSSDVASVTREMEYLNRGLVAILTNDGVFLSWRYLNTDSATIAFNVYKNGSKVNAEPITNGTNYVDTTGADSSHYQVSTIINGVESLESERVATWHNNYLPIRLDKPADGKTKVGDNYTYYAGDASVADLDGDGELEIIFLWSPSNSKDNSQSGYTGNVYIDAIKLDGSKLWRIDLGVNIRSGAHYTQLMVYDMNSDGKAEVVVKTSDGTIDGQGVVIGNANADHRNDGGYIITGPEYLTLFDGVNGAAISTVDYHPPRGDVASWGDSWGNRVDRFLAAIAYLDGEKPSVIVSRGYYTRTVVAAYDVVNDELVQRWVFDTDVAGQQYEGQGNHGLSIIDADGDGKDEIMFGALAIDDDGTVLYSTNLGHGDAMHAGKLDPNRAGYQVLSVHESTGAQYGLEMHDAATGEIIWGEHTGIDTGRGMSADIDPNYPGYESWATGITNGLAVPVTNLYAADGTVIASKEEAPKTANFTIWWDGDLQRELFDHDWDNDTAKGVPLIYNWDSTNKKLDEIFRAEGALTNNHTKGTPAVQADIIGDWREEILVRNEDSTEYRLYSTTIPTSYRIPTLMQDPTYRLSVAWQNVSYNQPPHTGFYLGTEATTFPKANISFAGSPQSLEKVKHFSFGSQQVADAIPIGNTLYNETAGYGFDQTTGLSVGAEQITVPVNSAFQVNMPNANYKVTVKVGHATQNSHTGIKSEYVQKIANTAVATGESFTRAYDVAVVDNQLEFIFTGTSNNIQEILIEKYPAKTTGPATTIYMAGDSTMQSYSEMFAPQQGWGEKFNRYFSSEVVVKNHAIGGRSSKSFLVDGRLDNILQEIKPGDFFFISFGHNDASAGIPDRYASPNDYKMYLKRYIDGAKQRGATPILLTPVGRRDFNLKTQQFNVSFTDYVNAAIEVAEQNDVQLIDLSRISVAFYNQVGLASTERLFLFTDPGEYPRYPNGVSDSTHFSMLGAQAIAKLVAETVEVMELPISQYVIDPEFVLPEPEPEAQVYEEDFEPDGSVDGYSIVNATGFGGTLGNTLEEVDGSTVLQFKGGGSGPRARVFRVLEPIAGNLIHMNFDWHPGTIALTPNQGTISIQDSNENILLTLYAKSDADATSIDYSIGPNEDNRASTTVMNKQWLNVDLTINYQEKTMDLTLTSRADSSQNSTITGIEIPSGINYQENVRAIRFLGTRASGRNLDWTTYLDNVNISGEFLPPKPGDKASMIALYEELKVRDISSYTAESVAVLNIALAEVEAVLEDILTQEQVMHLLNVLTVASDSLTIESSVLVSQYMFDFGSGDAAEGYIKVDSTRAYIEGNHYGFLET
ncbi:MAG TPA: hypothetical protein IAA29_04100, partial [Candidatus Paenibacillus intestinavium]|nr:hypothetical protein [Candidatus Paenibacillus intestinavium]